MTGEAPWPDHHQEEPVAGQGEGSVGHLEPSRPDVDAGRLAPWEQDDLPEPRPYSLANALKTIGPGAILLAGAIGGGEWIVGPLMAVEHGRGILWIATVAILLQSLFNLEAVRYTLYTGEPILTGIMRLNPGSWIWGPFYILLAIAQLGGPALAGGCAAVVFSAAAGRLPLDSDGSMIRVLTLGVVILGILLLLSGRSVEKVLERFSWLMVVFIFSFLLAVNVLFVPAEDWRETARGFVQFGYWPDQLDLLLLSVFAATAGSGGFGNLVISNWFRDKGFGMGGRVGGIGGVLASGKKLQLASIGKTFPTSPDNLRRWRVWWNYALIDQALLWGGGCVVGMFLNVNLATRIIPPSEQLSGYAAGAYQAHYMAEQLWWGFWALALLNGFWILFSTHLANTDCLSRTVCDLLWTGFPRVQRWGVSRLYAGLLIVFAAWGFVAVNFGDVRRLFEILGVVASLVMAIGGVQILRVNTRFLPPELRPPLWRRAGLLLCSLFYGLITAALLRDQLGTWLGG
jgi:hypothetical protein